MSCAAPLLTRLAISAVIGFVGGFVGGWIGAKLSLWLIKRQILKYGEHIG